MAKLAMSKSAKIELCVISSAPKQFGANFFELNFGPVARSSKRLKRSDEPVSAYEPKQIIEWSDFVGPVAGCDTNFEV